MKYLMFGLALAIALISCKKDSSTSTSTSTPQLKSDTAYSTCSCFYGDTTHGCGWSPGWTNGYDASAFAPASVWINVNSSGWKQLPCTSLFFTKDSVYSVVNVSNLSIGYKFGKEPKALPPAASINFRVVYLGH